MPARSAWSVGLFLASLAVLGLLWAMSAGDPIGPDPTASAAANGPRPADGRGAPPPVRPRSAAGLTLDETRDVAVDARPPDARRESVVRLGIVELQEMKQMNPAVFDDAAKRWNAQPRVKEIIAEWKEVEAAWKTQDDDAKAVVVPRMEAMWKEALGLLRTEVETSAREAAAGVK